MAAASSTKFTALESNPDMFTSFARSLGVSQPARFVDVWSFDDENLGCFPQPIVAVCVLYPSGLDKKRDPPPASAVLKGDGSQCFYTKQRFAEVGNACGTLALMHAVCNNQNKLEFTKDSAVHKFIQQYGSVDAERAADAVRDALFLREATQQAAETGQTETPSADDSVDSHFISFVLDRAGGRLLELDGMKPGPVDHGECTAEELFARAIRIVREDMMSRTDDLNFSVLALTTSPDEED